MLSAPPPMRRGRWACDTCGATGEVPAGETVETLLCHVCGEPVTTAD